MGEQKHIYEGAPGEARMKYLLFLPEGLRNNSRKKWPVILFLHGAGEKGNDLEILKRHGIPKVVAEQPEFPFVAVSPQCRERSGWRTHLDTIHSLLVSVLQTYPADPRRIYLTGISMGGNGAWSLAARFPTSFAAVAPVCGYGLRADGFPQKVCVLRDVPVWAFHGARDTIVPVVESQILVNTLKSCGGRIRFTVYPRCGHDSWTQTYENPELYRWFLSHSLSKPQ